MAGEATDEALSKRLRQLYQNMDDDLAIKLDRERMEFMRREDTQKHQHKLEIARYAAENSSRVCGPAAQAERVGLCWGQAGARDP